jgi:hypothetical protein
LSIATAASAPEPRNRTQADKDAELSMLALSVGDQLSGRVEITDICPRPGKLGIRLVDRDSGLSARIEVDRDQGIAQIRAVILRHAGSLMLSAAGAERNIHVSRRKARRKRA